MQKGLTFHLNKFYFLFTKDPMVLKKTKLSDRQTDNIHTLSGKNSAHVTLNQIMEDLRFSQYKCGHQSPISIISLDTKIRRLILAYFKACYILKKLNE